MAPIPGPSLGSTGVILAGKQSTSTEMIGLNKQRSAPTTVMSISGKRASTPDSFGGSNGYFTQVGKLMMVCITLFDMCIFDCSRYIKVSFYFLLRKNLILLVDVLQGKSIAHTPSTQPIFAMDLQLKS